ncbi:MAG: Ig-like domain-containing protein, partial [Oscillospiraceae bacterium]|nr:Ig-like domain-containing protein [Oscillospiraceae bacterium]
MKKRFLSLLLAAMLLLPSTLVLATFAAASEETWIYVEGDDFRPVYASTQALQSQDVSADLAALLRAGWATRAENINISSLGLPVSQTTFDMYYRAIYENQDIAYDVRTAFSYSYSGGTIALLKPKYLATPRATVQAAIEATANRMLATIPAGATELERVLAVNDFLALHVAYNQAVADGGAGTEEVYTAYGALGLGDAVCQGYSLAALYLFKYLNINALYCSSSSMNHGWNLVQVNGTWYHLDITWNDPLSQSAAHSGGRDVLGRVRHNNLLRSATGITATGHSGWDAGLPSATGTTYDSYFWTSSAYSSATVNYNGNWLHTYSTNNKQLRAAGIPGAALSTTATLNYSGGWNAEGGGTWTLAPYIARYGNKLFYNTPTGLRYVALSTMTDNAFYTQSGLSGVQSVYEMRVEGDYAHIRLATTPNNDPYQDIFVPLLEPGAIAVTGLSAPITRDLTLAATATLQISGVAVTPSNASDTGVQWNSLDTSTVTVDQNGLLTGVAPGQAYVLASTENGAFAQRFCVTVTAAPIAVESIAVSPGSATVQRGATTTLTATISPNDADNQNIIWSSSNSA